MDLDGPGWMGAWWGCSDTGRPKSSRKVDPDPSLTPADDALIGNKAGATRLGFAMLLTYVRLTYVRREGCFPRRREDGPSPIVAFLARQVNVAPEARSAYRFESRTAN
jgi:hypothetical protein